GGSRSAVEPGPMHPRRRSSDTKLIARPSGTKSHRILVVEDNRDICEMMVTALRGQGYDVDTAALPEEGMERLRRRRYDLVVAHYDLPGKTGAVMLKEAAAEGLLPKTPSLVVTAHPEPQGVDDANLVRKPLDL